MSNSLEMMDFVLRCDALQAMYDDLRERSRQAEAVRQEIAKVCWHPEKYVEPYSWEHDNGYGRQHKIEGKRCRICYRLDLWNRNQWVSREELSND